MLCVLGLAGPVYALIEQGNYGWGSPLILMPFVLGILCLAGFIWREQTAQQPLLPLSLFSVRNFAVGNVATAFVYAALSIGGFIIVLFLQQVAGFPATMAALALLPVSIVNILLASWFGSLAGRFGPRWFMAFGPALAGVGYLLMLASEIPVNYWTQLMPGILLFAVGLSATVAPLTAAILGSVSEQQAGIGSAVNNAVSRVAGLIGIALVGLVVGGELELDWISPDGDRDGGAADTRGHCFRRRYPEPALSGPHSGQGRRSHPKAPGAVGFSNLAHRTGRVQSLCPGPERRCATTATRVA